MDPLDTIPPVFDGEWISKHEAIARDAGGIPPCIDRYNGWCFGDPWGFPTLDDELSAQLENHLREWDNDLVSRFTVLSFLCRNYIDLPSDALAEDSSKERAKTFLLRFMNQLEAGQIQTAQHAMWELKQAWLFKDLERLRGTGRRYVQLAGGDLNLLLGRSFWLRQSDHRFEWESIIEGETWAISLAVLFPPEPHCDIPDAGSVIYAKGCFEEVERVAPNNLGVHWGLLAHCAAMAGDPGRAASIYEEHWKEICQPGVAFVADASDIPLDELQILPPECQEIMADLWESAHQPDKVIESLEALRKVHPRRQGVNRRLAEIYARQMNDGLAFEHLRAEADCDEVFGEDPVVSFALRSGIAFRELQVLRERFENKPAITEQIARIRTNLQSGWSPFSAMSGQIREDWTWGILWCEGELETTFETVRPQITVFSCARAFENHLREQIFEPLRAKVLILMKNPSLPDGEWRRFVEQGRIELGTMLNLISDAGEGTGCVPLQELWRLLKERSSRPAPLRDGRWQRIRVIRNQYSHNAQAGSMAEARELVALCKDFLAMLEDPPHNDLPPQKAGRPQ